MDIVFIILLAVMLILGVIVAGTVETMHELEGEAHQLKRLLEHNADRIDDLEKNAEGQMEVNAMHNNAIERQQAMLNAHGNMLKDLKKEDDGK